MNDAEIDDRFFNLPAGTLEAIRAYQRAPRTALIQPIFEGIMAKYLPEGRATPEGVKATGDIPLNAFGLESLTLLEVVLDLQDALNIRLTDDELRGLHDLKETHALLVEKVAALQRGEVPATPSAPVP